MSPLQRMLPAGLLLVLPTLASGYAFTIITANGAIKQNQVSGQPLIWGNPQQFFSFNFNSGNKSQDFNSSAVSAMEEWNRVNTPVQYQLGSSGAQTCTTDGYNSAGWGTTACNGQPFGDSLAITQRSYVQIGGNWYLREADIVLDQSRNWQLYTGGLRLGVQDLHRVILHELGHTLGLDHPDEAGQTVTAIMNSHTSDIETLQADDRNGIRNLYAGGFGSASNTANQTADNGGSGVGGGGGGDLTTALLALIALAVRRAMGKSSPQANQW